MKLAFLLHLYQPITQEETVFKQVYTECYAPLLKFIKNKKNVHFTLNVPLSLLELMDSYGHSEWINDLKDLYVHDRVELVGCAAYHPLLTKIPQDYVEKQIILNEYGLGYYLGAHQGFEGESVLMLKNVRGFFPPELAVDSAVLKTVNSFGYDWILADETAVPWEIRLERSKSDAYSIYDSEMRLVVRDRDLSNLISFKRTTDMQDVSAYIDKIRTTESAVVVALDGELFGHHYKEGIYMLESLVEMLSARNIDILTVSDAMDYMNFKELPKILESTWGASDSQMEQGNIYPYWDIKGNNLQKLLWNLEKLLISTSLGAIANVDLSEYTTVAVWKDSALQEIQDKKVADTLHNTVLLLKFMNSDKYWWASGQILPNGDKLYHPGMITASLDIALLLAQTLDDSKVGEEITEKLQDIKFIL